MRDAFKLGWMRNSAMEEEWWVSVIVGQMRLFPLTVFGKVEEWRNSSATRQLQVRLAQLIEERVCAGLQWTDARTGRVLQQAGHEGDRLWRSPGTEHLGKERRHCVRTESGGRVLWEARKERC